MKLIILISFALLSFSFQIHAQSISTYDFVKILDGNKEEAIFYYQNNWKKHRVEAQKRKLIKSYDLIMTENENKNDFDLILITTYKDENQYHKREENFRAVMKKTQKDGLQLLNQKQPSTFRKVIFSKVGKSIK